MANSVIHLLSNMFRIADAIDLNKIDGLTNASGYEHASVPLSKAVLKKLIADPKINFIAEPNNKEDIALCQQLGLVDCSHGVFDNMFGPAQFVEDDKKYSARLRYQDGTKRYVAITKKKIAAYIKEGCVVEVAAISHEYAMKLGLRRATQGNFSYYTSAPDLFKVVEVATSDLETVVADEEDEDAEAPIAQQPVAPSVEKSRRHLNRSISFLKKKG